MKKNCMKLEKNILFVPDEINFANVMQVYRVSLKKLNKLPTWQFDFSQIKTTHSVQLAIMLEWIKAARQQNKVIQFFHIPDDLWTVAQDAGLKELLQTYCGA